MNLIESTLLFVCFLIIGVSYIWWLTHKSDSQILNLLIDKHETKTQWVSYLYPNRNNKITTKLVDTTLNLLRVSNQFIKNCFKRSSPECEVSITLDIEEKQVSLENELNPSFEEWANMRRASCRIRLKIHKLNCTIGKSRGVSVMPSIQEEDY